MTNNNQIKANPCERVSYHYLISCKNVRLYQMSILDDYAKHQNSFVKAFLDIF